MRFFAVGCFNTGLDFFLFNVLLLGFGAPIIIATTTSVTVGITCSYFLNHRIVFRHKHNPTFKKYLHFLAITGFSVIIIQNVVIWAVTHLVHVQEGQGITVLGHFIAAETIEVNIAKVMAVAIGMFWNFLLYKYVVFRGQSEADAEEELSVA